VHFSRPYFNETLICNSSSIITKCKFHFHSFQEFFEVVCILFALHIFEKLECAASVKRVMLGLSYNGWYLCQGGR
jgi:hypothetical protein